MTLAKITERNGLKGLSRLDGTVIVPEIYRYIIEFMDGKVFACMSSDASKNVLYHATSSKFYRIGALCAEHLKMWNDILIDKDVYYKAYKITEEGLETVPELSGIEVYPLSDKSILVSRNTSIRVFSDNSLRIFHYEDNQVREVFYREGCYIFEAIPPFVLMQTEDGKKLLLLDENGNTLHSVPIAKAFIDTEYKFGIALISVERMRCTEHYAVFPNGKVIEIQANSCQKVDIVPCGILITPAERKDEKQKLIAYANGSVYEFDNLEFCIDLDDCTIFMFENKWFMLKDFDLREFPLQDYGIGHDYLNKVHITYWDNDIFILYKTGNSVIISLSDFGLIYKTNNPIKVVNDVVVERGQGWYKFLTKKGELISVMNVDYEEVLC